MTLLPGLRRPEPPASAEQAGARPRTNRLAALDGLRLVAALIVSLYHYTGYTRGVEDAWGAKPETAFPTLHHVGQYGWMGVQLFFMISGFVICMSCWGRTPGAFFQSRIIRLFPAYWAAVLITTAVITIWPVVRNPKSWHDVVLNLTMLQAPIGAPHVDAVYWTLWNEALFYLLFTVVVWRGLTLRRTVIFGYSWLLASAISFQTDFPLLKVLLQAEYAPFFVAGITLYLIHRFGPDMLLWGLLAASFAMAQYWTFRRVGYVGRTHLDTQLSGKVGAALVTLFFVILLAIALGYTSRIQWRWLTTAGLLTYPFYLLHENIGWTIIYGIRDFAPRPVVLAVVIAIMLVSAYLLHRLFEKPVARILKKRLAEAASSLGRGDRYASARPAAPAPLIPAQRASAENESVAAR
ncbi:acyltransferase family protein [Actinoplanes sp. CA-015351]|uniref:acyltransferase family protein n=1 Tax=Actinoplanes sp. CA-015351 TaxID=3239897 RepID=UPI003D9861B3